jgi:hypothetical protein
MLLALVLNYMKVNILFHILSDAFTLCESHFFIAYAVLLDG